MEISFIVLNKQESYTGSSFTVDQTETGAWEVCVDGEEVYSGDFAPSRVEITE